MDEYEIINKFTDNGLLSESNRLTLFQMQKKSGRRMLHLATEAGMFSEEEIVDHLAALYGFEKTELDGYELDQEGWDKYIDFFMANHLVPLKKNDDTLSLALFDPSDSMLIRSIEQSFGIKTIISLLPQKEIVRFWDDLLKNEENVEEDDIEHIIDIASEAPVVRVVSDILSRAVELCASDIHLEARDNDLKLRYRIDGILHNFAPPPSGMGPAIISRIKILANLDIAERRKPQDGAIKLTTSAKDVDVRVSCIPTVHGESVVLRILDKESTVLNLEALGLDGENSRLLISMLEKSYGMVVVAGPTGAGKTTTLYAALEHIRSETGKIVTIEDPVEFKIKDVTQIQVNPKAGLTFANGLKSILRHDPDIMLVGEIRDSETASISIQAALTGHLVLTTLHANRASQVFSRLIDMGIEAFLASASILGSMSQRLVRKICPACKEIIKSDSSFLKMFNVNADTDFYSGAGCKLCNYTGYKGRIGIYEIMQINDEIQHLILTKAPVVQLENAAAQAGFKTMTEDGIAKAKAGLTTIEEIIRVAG
ncbi:hypothetical protein BuS5_03690 [Desulfosarcina sp. BuS5]|uniref:GspE/PulE family protein n=1 Tax=Desulfosarcina sp. BuS5 TaxID=933262 RepID=UPI0004838714|nr:GspE/PulE family protein [Desulfosarcina sp. BuS5]WDN90719.1 hypothetical protein BuS5_03690 [Desulfosarcina sp. BuS5]